MDLLNPTKSNLNVRRDPIAGVQIKDATEMYVSSATEMLGVMNAGSK